MGRAADAASGTVVACTELPEFATGPVGERVRWPLGQPIRHRIELFGGQKRWHASSLIVSLFGDLVRPRGGRIWLGSLIRLLEPLALSERLVRSTVFRLARDQWLSTEVLG